MRVHLKRFPAAAAMLLALCMIFAAVPAVPAQADNKGPEKLVIEAGSKGNITLPHREHQQNLRDCKICHTFFPKKAGSITVMKADGKLKKKQVMNKLCLNCHRKLKKAGKDAGPTSCSGCHKK
jgi:hypothetical protein